MDEKLHLYTISSVKLVWLAIEFWLHIQDGISPNFVS
jgi:hypothetical protein